MLQQLAGSDQLAVARHTVPPFVPLAQLAAELLNADLNAFLDTVDDHVQAFVARREQAVALQRDRAGVAVVANKAFTYVRLDAEAQHQASVYLIYDDLCSSLPTRATALAAAAAAADKPQRLRDLEPPFLQERLLPAFARAFGPAETAAG
jgi:hypothetical protein